MPKKLLLHSVHITIIAAISYVLCELIYSTLYVNGWITPVEPFWVSEDSGKTVHFDPVLGYRLTATPSRVAKISNGMVEFRAVLQGNAQGFSDGDDFSIQPTDLEVRRIAVLGNSFTAAQYLEQDWTRQIENYAREAGKPVEMLNFAVAGGGLANWWSIIKRHIETEGYVLDGVIFAVFEANLHRGFSVSDHRDQLQHAFARIPSWQPEQWPQTLAQALPYMQFLRGYILSPEAFEQAINGRWLPPDPKPEWRPYAALEVANIIKHWSASPEPALTPVQVPPLTDPQLKLIDDIALYLHSQNLPVIVASIPSRESLLTETPTPDDVKQFATRLKADFIDGSQAFAGLSEAQIRAHWLPVDGHWGQRGSDAFARLIWQTLEQWPPAIDR